MFGAEDEKLLWIVFPTSILVRSLFASSRLIWWPEGWANGRADDRSLEYIACSTLAKGLAMTEGKAKTVAALALAARREVEKSRAMVVEDTARS